MISWPRATAFAARVHRFVVHLQVHTLRHAVRDDARWLDCQRSCCILDPLARLQVTLCLPSPRKRGPCLSPAVLAFSFAPAAGASWATVG